MSGNPERSKLAQVARLSRQAEAAAAAGRVAEAAAFYEEAARLDPRDRRTLHRLGDFHRLHLRRPAEAARYYAAEARCSEREGFEARAIAVWRLVLRCDPAMIEAHQRIGDLYLDLGRVEDARQHYERSARELREAGLAAESAVLRAHLAALEAQGGPPAAERSEPPASAGGERARGTAGPDDTTANLAADRLQNARLYHHYGLHAQARQQLEELLASLPEHLEARQLLVEVSRALGDAETAGRHLRVVTLLLRRQGEAAAPASEVALELPPVEEWVPEEPEDPMAALAGEIREDVERLVECLERKGGRR